jgi:hypothetical protein
MIGRKTLKQILIGLLSGILILSACGQTASVTPIASIPVVNSATATSSPIPTNTVTTTPTETPTASITPLPTIPTFTPTFNTSTIVTVTPAPKAECPEINSAINVENYLPGKLEYPSPNTTDKILDFLNEGGDGQTLVARLEQIYPNGGDYRGGYDFFDVTGDQSPEFLYVEINYEGQLLAFSCKNGKYELLATLPEDNDFLEYTMQTVNLNMNGIPEIIVMGTNGVSHPISTIYFYEWNGKVFANLGHANILALRQNKITDVDGNGSKEISFSGDNPTCVSCSNFIPQRQRTISYSWNGKSFVEVSNEFTTPKYRFQSIQDADAAVIAGKYEKAIELYNEAISNDTLAWWSPERFTYEQHIGNPVIMFIETPSSIPTEDLTEYPRLAAYAYYRIMLLHLVQQQESEAEITYNTLQEKFDSDQYGQPYVEMATAFWNAYQPTYKMYNGCAAAIKYAAEHPEILTPLGSDYHGWQSHTYVPADVCPFR